MKALLNFSAFLAVRIASVFIVKTFFVPDEYWQSLEVAHKLTFGYGYLTWEWKHGIRSYIYPAFIAGIYKILALLNWDTVELLVILPRIFQALLSTYADYRVYVWTGKKKWAAFMLIVPYFWFYSASRTLANTLETDLTAIGLSYFPWESECTSFIWIAALCCYLRPTAAVLWVVLCFYHLRKTKYSAWDLLLKRYLLIGVAVLSIGTAVDSFFYKKITITPWEFLKYNVVKNIGTHYGSHQWFWYFTTGLPIALGLNIVPFMIGAIETFRHRDIFPTRKVLLTTIIIYISVLSFLPHKEVRFLLVLMPMIFYICSDTLSRWSHKASSVWLWLAAAALIASNVFPAWYISTVHQRGTLDAMTHLEKLAKEYKDVDNHRASFLFLMPCHSTPFYSHIHQNITMRFLTCEPNFENKLDYIDEADKFYEGPDFWLRSHLPSYPKSALPTHVILFDSLKDKIADFLINYDILYSVQHTEVILNERTGKYVLVYQRSDNTERPWEEAEQKSEAEDDIESI